MRITYSNPYLERLVETNPVGKPIYPDSVVKKFRRIVSALMQAKNMRALSRVNAFNLEVLKGDRAGRFSIRIDLKYRLIGSVQV